MAYPMPSEDDGRAIRELLDFATSAIAAAEAVVSAFEYLRRGRD